LLSQVSARQQPLFDKLLKMCALQGGAVISQGSRQCSQLAQDCSNCSTCNNEKIYTESL